MFFAYTVNPKFKNQRLRNILSPSGSQLVYLGGGGLYYRRKLLDQDDSGPVSLTKSNTSIIPTKVFHTEVNFLSGDLNRQYDL